MTYNFLNNHALGRESEQQFAQFIASQRGAAVAYVGHVPGMEKSAPCFLRHHQTNPNGFVHSVAPDLIVSLPVGRTYLVQVKRKDMVRGELAFYLDELELYRMRMAAILLPVLFVVHATQLAGVEGYGEWLYLDVADLAEDHVRLIKREVRDTKTFIVPLNLFRPIADLVRNPDEHQPANANTPPASKVA